MKKWLLALTLLTFLGTTAAFTASMQPIERHATPDKPSVFQVTVTNNESTSNRFTFNNDFTKSGWMYYTTSAVLEPGETRKFNVTIDPGKEAIQQSYSFTIYVTKFSTGETEELTDYMSVNREYNFNIKDYTLSDRSLEPGEEISGSMTVQNLASRIINDYTLYSTFNGENKTRDGIAIAPGALKTYSFTHKVPENSPPGQRNFTITISHSRTQQTFYRNITVEEVRNVTRTASEEDKVLYQTGKITFSNSGNSNVTVSENLTFSAYLDSVLTFNPEPHQEDSSNSEIIYSWEFDLKPGQTETIEYRVNYWVPLAIAAAILFGIVLLRRLSGSVKIVKKVEEVEDDKLKISIELTNNSEKVQDDLRVKGFVPNVAKLDEDFQMTEPDTKRTTEGVELEWKLDDFKPGEERVIQYEIEPKVEVEGGIELRPAELQKDGETIRKSSRK
jgi:hypothetical protein